MPVYTIVNKGRAIVAFQARDKATAENCLADEDFQDPLWSVNDSNDVALWNGVTELSVRLATEFEAGRWRRGTQEMRDDEEYDGSPQDIIVYLVPVKDPQDEEGQDDSF